MKLDELKGRIPDYGRDIRLNVETVLSTDGSPGLTARQIWGTALACAYALSADALVQTIRAEGLAELDDGVDEAAKSAATIMAMNNIYYRSMHLIADPELKKLPVRLRMNVIGKPTVPKPDFELMSLAVSALSGCGQCLTAHVHEARKASFSDEAIQSVLRLASVLNAVHQVERIQSLS